MMSVAEGKAMAQVFLEQGRASPSEMVSELDGEALALLF
jgi:hypothetical protein